MKATILHPTCSETQAARKHAPVATATPGHRFACLAFVAASLMAAVHPPALHAQAAIEATQVVAVDTPEAWAMRHFAATTLFTAMGVASDLAPWRWAIAGDLGSIPRLDDLQRRVGFGGFKEEDLNKSPVFGRLRVALGLPQDAYAEIGYTPPVAINGSQARHIVAAALGRRWFSVDGVTLSTRVLGQAGSVRGDITCPARVAGSPDPDRNPYGCEAPSRDVFETRYYGADATLGWERLGWKLYANAGVVRSRLAVQVDAVVFGVNDRTRLVSHGNLRWLAVGVTRAIDRHWSATIEGLYVPLDVRRPPDFERADDPLRSVRLQLRYAFD